MEPHRKQSDANESPVWKGQSGPETPVFVWLHPAETIDTVDDYNSYQLSVSRDRRVFHSTIDRVRKCVNKLANVRCDIIVLHKLAQCKILVVTVLTSSQKLQLVSESACRQVMSRRKCRYTLIAHSLMVRIGSAPDANTWRQRVGPAELHNSFVLTINKRVAFEVCC
jgi:hypothetical protein